MTLCMDTCIAVVRMITLINEFGIEWFTIAEVFYVINMETFKVFL